MKYDKDSFLCYIILVPLMVTLITGTINHSKSNYFKFSAGKMQNKAKVMSSGSDREVTSN